MMNNDFIQACEQGDIAFIKKYLSQDPSRISIEKFDLVGVLTNNCPQSIKSLRFLVEKEELMNQLLKDIFHTVFEMAFYDKAFNVLKFFILEQNYEMTPEFSMLKNGINYNAPLTQDSRVFVQKMIDAKNLYNKMENELEKENNLNIKKKI